MKRILLISNGTKPTSDQYNSRKKINLGNITMPSTEAAHEMGYEVYIGINREYADEIECNYDVKFYNASIYRSLLDFKSNYKAFKNLNNLLKKEKIDVIHCNTPIGGILGRICGRINRVPKIMYTAHGFHFYKGGPIIKNTIYRLAESFMAKYTDVIITMNSEDYKSAQKLKLRNRGNVYYIPGVGIDVNNYKINILNKKEIRKKLGFKDDDIILICLGDLIYRKNYKSSIEAVYQNKNSKIHFIICGTGPEKEKLIELSQKLGIESQIHFLGYRDDIKELLNISDIFLFTTYQEGLPRSMMEAMASGLPCIASNIRGNIDLIDHGAGGYLVNPDDIYSISRYINKLVNDEELRKKFSTYNKEKIKKFDIDVVKNEIKKIYKVEL